MKGGIARLLSVSSFLSCHVMAAILDLIKTEIALFDLQTLKTLSCKHKVDGITRLQRYGHSKFDISQGVRLGPPFWEGEVVGSHRSYNSKERWQVSIGSFMTIVLSLTIRPLFHLSSNVCDAQINRGKVGQNFRVFHLE